MIIAEHSPMAATPPARLIRLGFPVRVVGRPSLRAAYPGYFSDASDGHGVPPHLSISLLYLHDILHYLEHIKVRFYRLASTLLPIAHHADALTYQQALEQIGECREQLALLANQIEQQGVRLTMHPEVALGCEDDAQASRGAAAIEVQAMLLEQLGTHAEGSIVVHMGGSSRDPHTLQRFARRYHSLSVRARARLVVEHDTSGWSLGKLLQLHQHCGIPVVFDYLHYRLSNPEHLPLDLALGLALATWPPAIPPEVHLSSGRSEAHLVSLPGERGRQVVPPRPGQHADFILVTDLVALLEAARGLRHFDLMLEAKAGDLALLRVRSEIARVGGHLAVLLA